MPTNKKSKNSTKTKKTIKTKKTVGLVNKKKIKELSNELDLIKNKNIRLLAEFDNYKRRTADEKNNLIKFSGEIIILDMLRPLDDLKRTIDSYDDSVDASLIDGIKLVYKKFQDNLKNNGIEVFVSIGKQFDPELHEAVLSEKGSKDNIILKEFEPGYKYHDKVIRHAKVVVSKKK